MYFRSLAENTALCVLGDIMPQSFQSWFLFLLGRTQQNNDQMRFQDLLGRSTHAVPICPQKTNSSSCTSQQWHPRQCVCDCLSNSYRPGLFNFLGEEHISYCTTLRGPDILCNMIFSGYITFYQIDTLFANIHFFRYWQNVFCGWVASQVGFVPRAVVRRTPM